MALGAGLPAAPAPGARFLLPLALAPEQPLRQRRPGGAKLREFGLQPRPPGLRPQERTPQPRVLPGQAPDRALLAMRPPQGLAEFRARARRRPRAQRLLRAQQPRLQPSPRDGRGSERDTQFLARFPQLPAEIDDLLHPAIDELLLEPRLHLLQGQPSLQPLDLLAQTTGFRAQGLDLLLPPLHGPAQTRGLLAQRLERAGLPGLDAGFAELLLQPLYFRLERPDVLLRRAADFLQLIHARGKLPPAVVETPLQRTRTGAGIHFLPPQLLAARLRLLRARARARTANASTPLRWRATRGDEAVALPASRPTPLPPGQLPCKSSCRHDYHMPEDVTRASRESLRLSRMRKTGHHPTNEWLLLTPTQTRRDAPALY